jgi:Flp pilus assembly protein TadD
MKFGSCLLAILLCAACGGSTPPPDSSADPPLDDTPSDVAPASSEKVKQGVDAIQAGDFAAAKAVLSEAHAEAPKDPQAAFYLGVAQDNLGERDAAKQSYQAALALDPKLTEASVNLSAMQLEQNDAPGALEVVTAALAHAPKDKRLLTNRALALEATGDAPGATKAYAAAVAADPENLELRYAYAELLAQGGDKETALAELRKLVTGAEPPLLAAAGNLFGKLGAFGDCVAALDKAITAKAAPALHVRRGVCRHEMKDEPGAKQDFDAAVALDGKFAPAHYYLGQHYLAAKKKKEAIAAFKKAAELGGDQGVGPAAKKALEDLGVKK